MIVFEIPPCLLSGILIEGVLQNSVFGNGPAGGGFGVGAGDLKTSGKLSLLRVQLWQNEEECRSN